MKQNEMPVGFTMALAMNTDAMEKFAKLSEKEKQDIIARTHTISSKEEMRSYVNSLVNDAL